MLKPSPVLSIGIHGATGRMGLRLIELINLDPSLQLGAALDRDGHPSLGQEAGSPGIVLSSSLDPKLELDAMIDFSSPNGSLAIADVCRARGIPLVVGTTGLTPTQRHAIEAAAAKIPLLISPNLSRAVNLLMRLAGEAAKALGASADIEIIERHHHHKKDAPSGTALRLAEVVGEAVGSGPDRYTHGRCGDVGARPKGEIGLHALRVGDNPGEHTVVFGLLGESLELTHRALNRDGFALGALDAAKFLATKPAGIYTMRDLLG